MAEGPGRHQTELLLHCEKREGQPAAGTDGALPTDDKKKGEASSKASTFYSIHPAS